MVSLKVTTAGAGGGAVVEAGGGAAVEDGGADVEGDGELVQEATMVTIKTKATRIAIKPEYLFIMSPSL